MGNKKDWDEESGIGRNPATHVHGPDCNHDHEKVAAEPFRRAEAKQGRNEPCACGSGKKYKKCHGAAA